MKPSEKINEIRKKNTFYGKYALVDVSCTVDAILDYLDQEYELRKRSKTSKN